MRAGRGQQRRLAGVRNGQIWHGQDVGGREGHLRGAAVVLGRGERGGRGSRGRDGHRVALEQAGRALGAAAGHCTGVRGTGSPLVGKRRGRRDRRGSGPRGRGDRGDGEHRAASGVVDRRGARLEQLLAVALQVELALLLDEAVGQAHQVVDHGGLAGVVGRGLELPGVAVHVLVPDGGRHETHGLEEQRVQGAEPVLVDVLVAQIEQRDVGDQDGGRGDGTGGVPVEDVGVEVGQLAEAEGPVTPLDVVGLGFVQQEVHERLRRRVREVPADAVEDPGLEGKERLLLRQPVAGTPEKRVHQLPLGLVLVVLGRDPQAAERHQPVPRAVDRIVRRVHVQHVHREREGRRVPAEPVADVEERVHATHTHSCEVRLAGAHRCGHRHLQLHQVAAYRGLVVLQGRLVGLVLKELQHCRIVGVVRVHAVAVGACAFGSGSVLEKSDAGPWDAIWRERKGSNSSAEDMGGSKRAEEAKKQEMRWRMIGRLGGWEASSKETGEMAMALSFLVYWMGVNTLHIKPETSNQSINQSAQG